MYVDVLGEARSKKMGKRIAAEKMLKFLESMPSEEGYDADEEALTEVLEVKCMENAAILLRVRDLFRTCVNISFMILLLS